MIRDGILQNIHISWMIETIYKRGYDWQLLLVGIALVAFGQIILVINDTSADDGISASGRFFLISGFLAVAVSAYFFHQRRRNPIWTFSAPRSLRFNLNGLRKVWFGIGLASSAFLTLRLLGGSISGNDIWLWVIGILGISIVFAPPWARIIVGCRKMLRSIRFIDFLIVGILISLFSIIHIPTLTDWYYSAIGDEYIFYELGSQFTKEGITAPFSQLGIYDYHPRLGILMKSSVMNIVGNDHFGWKFSSVVMFCLTIPGVYVAGTLIGGRVAGAVAAVILGFSHYLAGFTHIGYDHIDSLLPAIWSVVLFLLASKTKNPLLYFIAGVATGLCIYTNIVARVIFPAVVITAGLLHILKPQAKIGGWAVPWLLGCVVAVFPIFLIDGYALIDQTLGRVIGGQGEVSDLTMVERLLRNVHLNLYAFNFNEKTTHYVSGSLLDPVSAILAVAATAFAVGRFRDDASLFLVVWVVLAFVATGGISPYDWHTAVTRLFPMMLPLSLLIGLFVSNVYWPIKLRIVNHSGAQIVNPRFFSVIGIAVISVLIWQMNYQRVVFDTPSVFQNSPASVSIGAMRSDHCASFELRQIAFVSRDVHLIRRILDSYDPGSVELYPSENTEGTESPLFLDHQQAQDWDVRTAMQFGCVIISHPWEGEPSSVMMQLREAYPSGGVINYSDQSGKTTIVIFRPM